MPLVDSLSGVIMFFIGIIVCFFGYRFLRITLVIVGLVQGVYWGYYIATKFGAREWVVILSAIILGTLAVVLVNILFEVAIFLLGAIASGILITIFLPFKGWGHILSLIVGGVLGGTTALVFHRPVISFLTSFLGSWWIVAGVYNFGKYILKGSSDITRLHLGKGIDLPILVFLWIILGLIGFLIQFFKTGNKGKEE